MLTCQPSLKVQHKIYVFKYAQRPRNECKNGATLRQSKASWELPGCKTSKGLKSRSPLVSPAKLVIKWSMTMNLPKGHRNSYVFTLLLWWTLENASFALHARSAGWTRLLIQPVSPSQHWFWSTRSIASSCSQGSRWYVFTFLLLLSAASTRNPWNQGAQPQSWSCLTV